MILADARWAKHQDGIGRFAREVLKRLSNIMVLEEGPKPLQAIDPLWLSWQLYKTQPKLYFSPGFNPPLWSNCPVIMTVHDLIHLKVPAESSFAKQQYYRYVLRPAIRKANITFTVSQFSQQEIANWADIPLERIIVVGNGVDSSFESEGDKVTLDEPYFLYIGNRKPHKNVELMLKAFASSKASQNTYLVLSGVATPDIRSHLQTLQITSRIKFAGFIAESSLAGWYRGAIATLMPSLYEGFGLPALESLACGTPVLAAQTTSLTEVVGEAGLYFEPKEATNLAVIMDRIIDDSKLREVLTTKATVQAAKFDWDNVTSRISHAVQEHFGLKVS
ncbi:protein RfbU-like [Ylistrum balloti]|uniref:protein RfbU-like n=1 Tax=Ylistrum balloti TaxID=509963 RepID=UPI002905F1EB|nr:protein RfbU-like [Ylistrum balloti]